MNVKIGMYEHISISHSYNITSDDNFKCGGLPAIDNEM
jgi:hypothetical protein